MVNTGLILFGKMAQKVMPYLQPGALTGAG